MQPLEDLLHRITWDAEFGNGAFALGYYDRIDRTEHMVPFQSVRLDPKQPGTFLVEEKHGVVSRIPLHRVRTVYKDGVVIWHRPAPTA